MKMSDIPFGPDERVTLSEKGRRQFTKAGDRQGTVIRRDKGGHPIIHWDGLKHPSGPYHPSFIQRVEG